MAQEIEVPKDFISGYTVTDTFLSKEIDETCYSLADELLKPKTLVMLYGYQKCNVGEEFYKAFYHGQMYFVKTKEITLSLENEQRLKNLDSVEIANLELSAQKLSVDIEKDRINRANAFLSKCKKKGILIKDATIFDQSDYTNGTGLNISIVNLSKKEIKYIWFTIKGINPVGDLVSSKTVKGIGPISTDFAGEYSFDYIWHTDVVETFELPIIKIQYMDGTFVTVQKADDLIVPKIFKDVILESFGN